MHLKEYRVLDVFRKPRVWEHPSLGKQVLEQLVPRAVLGLTLILPCFSRVWSSGSPGLVFRQLGTC
jgi:hypothetical protein